MGSTNSSRIRQPFRSCPEHFCSGSTLLALFFDPARHPHDLTEHGEAVFQNLEDRKDAVAGADFHVVLHVAGWPQQPTPAHEPSRVGMRRVVAELVQTHEGPGTSVARQPDPYSQVDADQWQFPATQVQPDQQRRETTHGDSPLVQSHPAPRWHQDVLHGVRKFVVVQVLFLGQQEQARQFARARQMHGDMVHLPDAAVGEERDAEAGNQDEGVVLPQRQVEDQAPEPDPDQERDPAAQVVADRVGRKLG